MLDETYRSTEKETDFQLICQIKLGAEHKFEPLFERYRPMVYCVIRKYYLKLWDTEDFLQEARAVCFRALNNYRPDKGITFGQYFKTSLSNCIFSLIRKESAAKRLSDVNSHSLECYEETYGECERPAFYCELLADDRLILQEKLNAFELKLSEFERSTFVLLYYQTKTPEEITLVLDCDIKKVSGAISRCKSKLGLFFKENR